MLCHSPRVILAPKQMQALHESPGILRCRGFDGCSCLHMSGDVTDLTHPEERNQNALPVTLLLPVISPPPRLETSLLILTLLSSSSFLAVV